MDKQWEDLHCEGSRVRQFFRHELSLVCKESPPIFFSIEHVERTNTDDLSDRQTQDQDRDGKFCGGLDRSGGVGNEIDFEKAQSTQAAPRPLARRFSLFFSNPNGYTNEEKS